jgi:hypothetical protein
MKRMEAKVLCVALGVRLFAFVEESGAVTIVRGDDAFFLDAPEAHDLAHVIVYGVQRESV